MRWPLIPRSVYDDLLRRHDDLMERYHALRLAGAQAPAKAVGAIAPAPSPEERARVIAEQEYAANVVRDLVGQGFSETDARQLAAHLREAALDLSPVPMDG